jgi:hypothetical protein
MTGFSVNVTAFRKDGGPLGKLIHLNADGTVGNDSSQCFMSQGTARRVELDSATALAAFINKMEATDAYALGRMKDGHPDRVRVVTDANIGREKGNPNVIARTKKFLTFIAGAPGIALIDIDLKAISEGAKRRITEAGGIWKAMCSVCPQLATAAYVQRASTSSGITNTKTGEVYRGSGGFHVAVMVMNAADIPRFLADLHDRLWLAGFGWGVVSAAGSFLERSLIDKAVGSPERLIFEGPPIVKPPLVQAPRPAEAREGDVLDTKPACPPLTTMQKAEVKKLKDIEELRLLPERLAARAKWSEGHIKRMVDRGMPEADARATVDRWIDRKILTGDFPLPFDDPNLAGTTVAQVLADPGKYAGATLADPFEGPAYGRGKAQLFKNGDRALIHSFAHGGANYELKDDAAGAGLEDTVALKFAETSR